MEILCKMNHCIKVGTFFQAQSRRHALASIIPPRVHEYFRCCIPDTLRTFQGQRLCFSNVAMIRDKEWISVNVCWLTDHRRGKLEQNLILQSRSRSKNSYTLPCSPSFVWVTKESLGQGSHRVIGGAGARCLCLWSQSSATPSSGGISLEGTSV